jgi:hypothetical protein
MIDSITALTSGSVKSSFGASIVMDEVAPCAVRKDITNFLAIISPLSV